MFNPPPRRTHRRKLYCALFLFISLIFINKVSSHPQPNSPPTAVNDSYNVHGTTTVGPFLLNDSDPDGDSLYFHSIVTNPSHGTLSITSFPDRKSYAPNWAYVGSDSFTYKMCDSHDVCSTATVSLSVNNSQPTPGDDSYNVHGTTAIGPFLGNDSDPETDGLYISTLLSQPTHGTLSTGITPDRKSYTPNGGYVGSDSFAYQVCDNLGACATGTVYLSVNDGAPVGVDDFYVVRGDTVIGPFLKNDSDPDGDPISAGGYGHETLVSYPQHGTLYGLTQNDQKWYMPNAGYYGSDSFVYNVCDSLAVCSQATIHVFVISGSNAVNAPYGCEPLDPQCTNNFNPQDGALGGFGTAVAGAKGASAGDPVNLATGRESYLPEPDLMVYNPSGPGVIWKRSYYSNQALNGTGGYSSPGLTRGWVNNYDISIQGPTSSGTWSALKLIYPNGAGETLTPQLDANSQPTGVLTPPPGAPYAVSGVPAGTTGQWQSITVIWKDQTKWSFTSPSVPRPATSRVDDFNDNSLNPSLWTLYSGATTPTVAEQNQRIEVAFSSQSGYNGVVGSDVDLTDNYAQVQLVQQSAHSSTDTYIYLRRGTTDSEALVFQIYNGSINCYQQIGWTSQGSVTSAAYNPSQHKFFRFRQQISTGLVYWEVSADGQAWTLLKSVAPVIPITALHPTMLSGSVGAGNKTIFDDFKFGPVSGTSLPFAGTYRLDQITSRTGQSLNFTWRSDQALRQVEDASTGAVLLSMAYRSDGKLSSVTDAYNRQVVYTYSTPGGADPGLLQSVSQIVTAGAANPPARWSYTYDPNAALMLNTNTVPSPTGSGNSTATINYDQAGRVSSLVDANGNQRVYTYGSGSTQVQVKDAANNVVMSWTQNYSTGGLNTGMTDAASHSSLIEYNDSANPLKPTRVVDKNGHETTYTYDQYGNVLTVTTPRNVTITYTWSYTAFALGRLTSVQEGSKPATTLAYDEPSGLLQSVTSPAPTGSGVSTVTTSYTYDSLGNVLTVTGPGNSVASQITTTLNYATDGTYSQPAQVGQPLTVTDNLGHAKHLRYDAQGRVTFVKDALGDETNVSYNLIGQTDTVTLPATGQTGTGRARSVNSYLYVGGPLTAATTYDESDVQVRQVSRSYGLEGEALSVGGGTEPVTWTYDALYRLKTLTDGNSHTTTYAYNSLGEVASVTMPGSEVVQYPSYDAAGNLLQRVDGNSVVTNYVYDDAESLLTDIQYPATTALNVHFGYDSYGRRSSMSDATGSQTYTYGNLDEPQSVTTTYTGIAAKAISYEYHPDGSRKQMATPAGTFTYSYDGAGRPSSMTNPFSEVTSWSYLDNDWLHTQTLGNAAVTTYSYNAQGQLTRLLNQINSNTLSDFSSISYDGAGNRTSITASVPGASTLSGVTSYTYDAKDQLTQEQSTRNGSYSYSFGYDTAGNPTTFKGTTKSYNANNQQTGTGYSYDNNGNPTTYSGTTLTFDPENRLTSYGSVLTAGYRGDGLRAWKQTAAGRTYFLYDGVAPVLEIDSTGTLTATTTFGVNGLVSRRAGTASTFYMFDAQGSVTQRLDASQSVLSNYLLSGHGQPLLSLAASDPYGYKAQWGYYTDQETGLHLLTYRYYDPSAGRFLTRDPINYRGGVNLYSYVSNNPISLADPLGLSPVEVIIWHPTSNEINGVFGHVSYKIDGYMYSWERNGMATPQRAEDYIADNQRYRSGTGYVLDFGGDAANDAFANSIIHAYDNRDPLFGVPFFNSPYNLFTNNCGDALGEALDQTGFGHEPSWHFAPLGHRNFIENDLGPYTKQINSYPQTQLGGGPVDSVKSFFADLGDSIGRLYGAQW